jgi:hypothetical protein
MLNIYYFYLPYPILGSDPILTSNRRRVLGGELTFPEQFLQLAVVTQDCIDPFAVPQDVI